MTTMEMKIAEAKKAEWNPTASELRKVIKFAETANKVGLVEVQGFFYHGIDDYGFATVEFQISDPMNDERLTDVTLESCIFDRRRSFVH